MGPSYRYSGYYQTPEELPLPAVIKFMDRLGVDCIVNASHYMINGGMEEANAEADEYTAAFPGRAYGYVSVCPSRGLAAVRGELDKYKSHPGFLGLKLLGGYHGPYTQPEYMYAFDFANEMGCPVLVHTWSNNPPLTQIAGIAENRPNMNVMCAHQGGGSEECSRELAKIMKDAPNLYMEICGVLWNTLSMEELVELAGEDRVIYGSDMVDLDPRYDFGLVVLSTLDDAVKKKILAENYLRLLDKSSMGRIVFENNI